MTVKCSKYAGTSIFKNLEITTLRFQDTIKYICFHLSCIVEILNSMLLITGCKLIRRPYNVTVLVFHYFQSSIIFYYYGSCVIR